MRKYVYFLLVLFPVLLSLQACKEIPKPEAEVVEEGSDLLSKLNDMIANDATNAQLRYNRARILEENGQYSEAIEDMRVAIIADSLNAVYYHFLSDLFMDSNNSSKSLLTMQKAAQLFPDSTLTQLKLSETYFILKQYDESIFQLNDIIRRQPNNAEAYLMLGLNFRGKGDLSRAINSFQTATEKDPNIVDAWIILGDLFAEKNEPIAKRYYETAVNVAPDNITALHSKAYYLQNHNDIDGALSLYKQINIIEPKYPDAYLNAGILMIEKDSLNAALEQFDILTKMASTNAKGYYFKAYTLNELGQKEAAKKEAQNAVNFDPNYKDAVELLEKLK
ncbi:MAG TPA: tetratricopeptide repeat protein [Saprospiraceae bacterium]|nr:tetratricopeptide repeat protein [Saprospiraceae bacterium]HPN71743.1 tetratricopeptide repeat protein [Saprospiraceae bacterium]